jgi:hypothetical protein
MSRCLLRSLFYCCVEVLQLVIPELLQNTLEQR